MVAQGHRDAAIHVPLPQQAGRSRSALKEAAQLSGDITQPTATPFDGGVTPLPGKPGIGVFFYGSARAERFIAAKKRARRTNSGGRFVSAGGSHSCAFGEDADQRAREVSDDALGQRNRARADCRPGGPDIRKPAKSGPPITPSPARQSRTEEKR